MTKQKMSRNGGTREERKNSAFETQIMEQGRGMKVREAAGITNKYTAIEEQANTESLRDRSHGEGKYEQLSRKLQQDWSGSGVVSPKYTVKERKGGRGEGTGKGRGGGKGWGWGNDAVKTQQRKLKQLDLSSVINTGLWVMMGVVGVRVHLVSHLRHIHILRVPVVRITIVGVWLRLVRHDVRVQTRVLHAITGSRVDVRWG